MSRHVAPDRDLGLQGHYAGMVTRSVAFLFDLVAVIVLYDLIVAGIELLVSRLADEHFSLSNMPVASWLVLVVIAAAYCVYPVAMGGRTFGMAVVGLRVVRPDGSPVGARGAVVRLLALPLSFLTLGIGFLLILLRSDRRALQDLIGRTAVVYAWDARAARVRFLVGPDGVDQA